MTTSTVAAAVCKMDTFQARVRLFMIKAGVSFMTEEAALTGHAERVVYAKSLFAGGGDVYEMALACVSDAAIQPGIDPSDPEHGVTDAILESAVNARFSAFAGVAT